MPAPSKETIFNTLNAKQVNHISIPSLFPELDDSNSKASSGWYYSDLHNLYGEIQFPTQPSFSAHIWQNFVMPDTINNKHGFPQLNHTSIDFYNNHVIQITHPYTLGNHHYKHAKDFKLSRYACWCLSRNNPNMIFSRTYFISPIIKPDMTFNEMNAWCYQFARINLRKQLAQLEKILNGILYKHHINFRNFQEQATITLFNETPAAIRNQNSLSRTNKKPLADYMGAATLFTKQRALKSIIDTINQYKYITPEIIYNIASEEFARAHTYAEKNLHTHPINDIQKSTTQQIQSTLTEIERKFITKYASQKIR